MSATSAAPCRLSPVAAWPWPSPRLFHALNAQRHRRRSVARVRCGPGLKLWKTIPTPYIANFWPGDGATSPGRAVHQSPAADRRYEFHRGPAVPASSQRNRVDFPDPDEPRILTAVPFSTVRNNIPGTSPSNCFGDVFDAYGNRLQAWLIHFFGSQWSGA